MKAKSISFNQEMIEAILDGRKTQTRRIVKRFTGIDYPENIHPWPYAITEEGPEFIDCPYGKPGDLLWVKETFREVLDANNNMFTAYKADFPWAVDKWNPSIHMPKRLARIWLEIDNVCIERLQDISEKDAQAEGTPEYYLPVPLPDNLYWIYGFNCMWNEIFGIESWKANPWVWVIKFRILSLTGKPE